MRANGTGCRLGTYTEGLTLGTGAAPSGPTLAGTGMPGLPGSRVAGVPNGIAPRRAAAPIRIPSTRKCPSDSKLSASVPHTTSSNRVHPASRASRRYRFQVKTLALKLRSSRSMSGHQRKNRW